MRHFVLAGFLCMVGCGSSTDAATGPEPERHSRRALPQAAPGRQATQYQGGPTGGGGRVDVRVSGHGGGTVRGIIAAQKALVAERATHHDERANEGIRDEALRAAAETLHEVDPADIAAMNPENPDEEARCDAMADQMEEETPGINRAQFRSRCMQFPRAVFECEERGAEGRRDPECRQHLATLDRERAAQARLSASVHQTAPPPARDDLAPETLEPDSLAPH